MTKLKREQVYRKAAERVFYNRSCCCYAIADGSGIPKVTSRELEIIFPEFYLMKQPTCFWWGIDDDKSRILALLFAAEMCRAANK